MNNLEKIQLYCINPEFLPRIKSMFDFYVELRCYYDVIYANNSVNDYGINLCLVNGLEMDTTIWFDNKKAIDFFDRLCFRVFNTTNTIFVGNRDNYNKRILLALRKLWKIMLLLSENDLALKEKKLGNEDLFKNTRLYYITKSPKAVKYVQDNIEKAFEYVKMYHIKMYEELFFHLYPEVYDNKMSQYIYYETRGKEYLKWVREKIAIDYSKLLGNVEFPIHDILNDVNAIRLNPIVYSEKYGFLYIYSDYKLGINNNQYWELSDQQNKTIELQIGYFIKYVLLKNKIEQPIFILINCCNIGYQYKVYKLKNIVINTKELEKIKGEIDV